MAHRAALVVYANSFVGDQSQAEDIVQEAYLRFAPAAEGKLENPAGYLYRIVRNLALDLRRSLLADKRRDAAQLVLVPADAADSGEDRLLERDELRRIEGALAELSPNVRDAFKMRRIGGYTLQEIADRFEVSIPTIDRWTQEALKHLSLRLHRSKRR